MRNIQASLDIFKSRAVQSAMCKVLNVKCRLSSSVKRKKSSRLSRELSLVVVWHIFFFFRPKVG